MSYCNSSYDGKHCSCGFTKQSNICCYCSKRITPDSEPDVYDDDGSEENKDA